MQDYTDTYYVRNKKFYSALYFSKPVTPLKFQSYIIAFAKESVKNNMFSQE